MKLYDFLALIGIALIGVGVWFQWNWPIACLVVGSLLLMAAIFMAKADTGAPG